MEAPEYLEQIGDQAGADVLNLYFDLLEAGATRDELADALADALVMLNTDASAQGEALADEQIRSWGYAVGPPLAAGAVAYSLNRDRLRGAVTTILDSPPPVNPLAAPKEDSRLARLLAARDAGRARAGVPGLALPDAGDAAAAARARSDAFLAGGRVERLGRSEVTETWQQTMTKRHQSMKTAGGWTRKLESTACQLCTWWSRDGQRWPLSHGLATHKGCTCTQSFFPPSTE